MPPEKKQERKTEKKTKKNKNFVSFSHFKIASFLYAYISSAVGSITHQGPLRTQK
jgi:hypothetical protein